jgi:hypothetical protein
MRSTARVSADADKYRNTISQRIHDRSLMDASIGTPIKEALERETRRFAPPRAATSAIKFCDIGGLVVNYRRA